MATAARGLRGSVATTLRDAFSVAGRIDMEHNGTAAANRVPKWIGTMSSVAGKVLREFCDVV